MDVRRGGADAAHVEQHNGELGTPGLHGMQHQLSADALVRVFLHICVHRHHVVLAVVLETMAGKEEHGVHVLAYQSFKVLDSLHEKTSTHPHTHKQVLDLMACR